ncbi:MAG: leucine-rich repeat protein, partial [Gammaproteobacteria bacterium]|nr:leucine-rich repeat protein [Gammaproteobacteria bacterium]
MQVLSLRNHQLSAVPANAFAGLTELNNLDLGTNTPNLRALPDNVFAGLAKLADLFLDGNTNLQLQPGNFNGLENLRNLKLPSIKLPPGNISLTLTPRDGGLRAVWDEVSDAKYLLRWKLKTASTTALTDFAAVDASSTLTYDITGLNNGAEYFVAIHALPGQVANLGVGDPALDPPTARAASADGTPFAPPGLPVDLSVGPRKSGELFIEWMPPPPAVDRAPVTGYRVRWKPVSAPNFAPSNVRDVPGGNWARSYSLKLPNDTAYEVQVAAKSAVGDSGYTAGVQGTPRVGICNMPVLTVRGRILQELGLGTQYCGAATAAQLAAIKTLTFQGALASFNTLPANAFAGLTGLENLLIEASNNLRSLSEDAFAGLPSLKKLVVRDNHALATLPAGVFANLANLEELDLSVHFFSALPENLFAGLAKLKKLNLENSNKRGSFLVLPHTGITTLPANAFAGLGKLEELNLRGNHFTALPANVFAGLGELKKLRLDRTKITNLPANAFADLAKLEELDLRENSELREFATGAFDGLPLKSLTVKGISLPDTPSVFNLTPGKTKLRAVWSESPGADYQLHWKLFTAAAFAPADRATVAAPTLTYDITGLEAQTTYQVRLTALPKRQGVASSATARWTFAEEFAATANKPGAPLNPRVQARESEKLR